MAVDLATLAIKVESQDVRQAQASLDSLTKSGAEAERQTTALGAASAGTTGKLQGMLGSIAAVTAGLVSMYAAYQTLSNIITTGMRMEAVGIALRVVSENAKISADTITFFVGKLKEARISTIESMSVMATAIATGIDIRKLPELATRARDIAVIAQGAMGRAVSTSEAMGMIMHGIISQQTEVFRTLGINIGTAEQALAGYAAQAGKTVQQLTPMEKANALLVSFMKNTEMYAGVAEAAEAGVMKQSASLVRIVEDAWASLWALFQPISMGIIMSLQEMFTDLEVWATVNKKALEDFGKDLVKFWESLRQVTHAVLAFVATHSEVLKWIAVFLTIKGALGVVVSLVDWFIKLGTAVVTLNAAFFGLGAATTGAQAGLAATATAAGTATAAFGTLQIAILGVGAALAVITLGYMEFRKWEKSIKELGEISEYTKETFGKFTTPKIAGQGLFSPGELTTTLDKGKLSAILMQQSIEGIKLDPDTINDFVTLARMSGMASKEIKEMQKLLTGRYTEGLTKEQNEQLDKYLKTFKEKQTELMGPAKEKGAGADRLGSLMDTLEKERARITEGSFGQIAAWYESIIKKIAEYATTAQDAEKAIALAREVSLAKYQKAADDFGAWYAKNVGDTYAVIDEEERQALDKFLLTQEQMVVLASITGKKLEDIAKENANREAGIREISVMKKKLEELKVQEDSLNATKQYLDTMGQLSPFLSEQLMYQRESLTLEKEIAALKLQELFDSKKITLEEYERRKALQALMSQAKEYEMQRKEWMGKGIAGGAAVWATERVNVESTRAAQSFIDTMRTAEQSLGEGMAAAFIGFLRGKQTDFGEMFFGYAEVFFRKAFTDLSGAMFDKLGGVMRGWLGLKEPTAKPDGTYWNPIWVEVRGGGGLGSFGGLGGFFGGLGGSPEYAGILTGQIEEDWGMAGMADWFGALEAEANGFYGAQVAGYASLTGQSGSWLGQLFGSVGSWFESLIGGFGGGGGGAGFLGGIGSIFTSALSWFGFHEGGVLTAHRGLRIPGWDSDERLVRMQTGEGVLPRHAMERIGRPLFEKLRQGDVPQEGETAPPGRPWNSIVVNAPITIKTPDPVAYKASRTQTQAQMAQDLTVAMRKLS